jgi:hypothetical protein
MVFKTLRVFFCDFSHARAILSHFDQRSQHYEVRTSREAQPGF